MRRKTGSLAQVLILSAASMGLLVATTACKEAKDKVQQKRKEVANEVGGAPKRTLDDVKKRTDAAMAKAAKRIEDANIDE